MNVQSEFVNIRCPDCKAVLKRVEFAFKHRLKWYPTLGYGMTWGSYKRLVAINERSYVKMCPTCGADPNRRSIPHPEMEDVSDL